MRINVYTEELLTSGNDPVAAEVVTANYVSSKTGLTSRQIGLSALQNFDEKTYSILYLADTKLQHSYLYTLRVIDDIADQDRANFAHGSTVNDFKGFAYENVCACIF